MEGAAERSEAGLASFFAAKPPPSFLIRAELFPAIHERPAYGLTPSHQSLVLHLYDHSIFEL